MPHAMSEIPRQASSHDRLLSAALSLIAQQGYAQTSTAQLARDLGVRAIMVFSRDGATAEVVSAGRPVCADPDRYSYVDVDNHGGAARAVRYLVEAGRTRIATVAGPKDMTAGADRLAGYRDALTGLDRFDRGLVAYGDFGPVSGEHATLWLLDRRPDVDETRVIAPSTRSRQISGTVMAEWNPMRRMNSRCSSSRAPATSISSVISS